MEGWAGLAMLAAGQEPFRPGFAARDLALVGFEPGGVRISLQAFRDRLEQTVAELRGNPTTRLAVTQVAEHCEGRARIETDERHSWLDPARFRSLAAENKLDYDEEIPLGKAIMLAGPDWHGVFDLTDRAAQRVFDAEFNREIAERAKRTPYA